MIEKIEEKENKKINLTHSEVDVNAKSILTVAQNMSTIGGDFVKVLVDVQCRVCTFMFFRKHVIPESIGSDKIGLKGIQVEAFLEVKVPFETAFALSTYMTETLKNIRQDNTIG